MTGIDGYDWSPLGGRNPVPGDPDAVRARGEKFSTLASTVSLQNRLLRGVVSDLASAWKGPAAEAFGVKAGPLPGELDKLVSSYDEAADALGAYWPKLREAQDQALAALAKARAATQAISSAQSLLAAQNDQVAATASSYNRLVNQPVLSGAQPSAVDMQAQQAAQTQAQANYRAAQAQAAATQSQLNSAQQSLLDAQTQCAQARSMGQAAASACGSRLEAAGRAGIPDPRPSLWGRVVSQIESGPVILKAPPAELGPPKWVNVPTEVDPRKLINVPADVTPGKLINVPTDLGPQILITRPAERGPVKDINVPVEQGPLINYAKPDTEPPEDEDATGGSEESEGGGGEGGAGTKPATTPHEGIDGKKANGGLGKLIDVDAKDPAANALAERIGGTASVRFANGPPNEFDAVSPQYVAQAKPANFKLSKAFRKQAKKTLRSGQREWSHSLLSI